MRSNVSLHAVTGFIRVLSAWDKNTAEKSGKDHESSGKVQKKSSAVCVSGSVKTSCSREESWFWQRKELWQHNVSLQSCLRSRVNYPSLMVFTGHFIGTWKTSTHTHACRRSHTHTHFHFFRSTSWQWEFTAFNLTQQTAHFLSLMSLFFFFFFIWTLKNFWWTLTWVNQAGSALLLPYQLPPSPTVTQELSTAQEQRNHKGNVEDVRKSYRAETAHL